MKAHPCINGNPFYLFSHGVCGIALIASLAIPVSAQSFPKTVDPSVASNPESVPGVVVDVEDHRRKMADRSEWNKVRAAHRKEESANPSHAIAAYQSFITSRNWHPSVIITASDVVARIYLSPLEDSEHAEKIYTWLKSHHGDHADMVLTVPGRAALLNAQQKYRESVDLLQSNWDGVLGVPSLLSHEYAITGLRAWDEALTHLEKREQLVSPMTKTFSAIPLMLDDRDADSAWAYDTIVKILLDTDRAKEALGWARLRFAQTPYDTHHIATASRQLTDIWQKADPQSKGWVAFGKAQSDDSLPNPLSEVPLPQLDQTLLQRAYNAMSPNPKYRHYTITTLIAQGNYGDAMKVAESISNDNPKSPLGVTEGCRVLKAAQLNLLGAAQLIKSLQGDSGDPLPSFYNKYPASS